MKKLMLALAMMATSIMAFAKNDLTLTSGDASCIAQKGMTVNVVFDYSDSYIYDRDSEQYMKQDDYMKKQGEDWVRDFPAELKQCEEAFVEEFNNDTKKATLALGSNNAEYTITVKLTEFKYGPQVIMFSKQIGYGDGTIEVRKNGSDEVLATFEFKQMLANVPGGISAMTLRRESCYEHIAEALVKFLNKLKK